MHFKIFELLLPFFVSIYFSQAADLETVFVFVVENVKSVEKKLQV